MELSHVGREKRKIDMLTFTVSLHTRIWRCLKAAPPPPISTLRSRKIGARKKLMDQGNQTPRAKLRSGQDFRLACPKRQIRPLDFGCWIGSQIGPFGFWTLPFGSYKFCTSPGFRIKDTRPRQLGSVDTYVQILPVEFDDGHAESKPASQYMTRVTGVQGTAKSLAPHRTHDEMIFTPIFQHFLIIQWGVRSAKHLPQMLRCWRWFAKLALFHGQSWSQ